MRIKPAGFRIIATTFVTLTAVPMAGAADIPAPIIKAPAAVPATTGWTGFYVNGGGGYGLWAAPSNTSGPFTSAVNGLVLPPLPLKQTYGGKGWLGRVGGGFDYQFNSRIVAGVFGDFDFSNLEGTIQDGFFSQSATIKQSYSWAAGVRGGWLVSPDIMTYVNAGFSSARFSSGTMVAANAGGVQVVLSAHVALRF